MGVSIVAIKSGAEGTRAYTRDARVTRIVDPVTGGDSIGAGDSFDAGFLAAWLRNLPLETCLEIGNRCGRAVASRVGGLAGQITWEKVISQIDLKKHK